MKTPLGISTSFMPIERTSVRATGAVGPCPPGDGTHGLPERPDCFHCRTGGQGSWKRRGRGGGRFLLAHELLHLPDEPAGVVNRVTPACVSRCQRETQAGTNL